LGGGEKPGKRKAKETRLVARKGKLAPSQRTILPRRSEQKKIVQKLKKRTATEKEKRTEGKKQKTRGLSTGRATNEEKAQGAGKSQ